MAEDLEDLEEKQSTPLETVAELTWASDPDAQTAWIKARWDADGNCYLLTIDTNAATLAHVQHNDGEMILKFEAVK